MQQEKNPSGQRRHVSSLGSVPQNKRYQWAMAQEHLNAQKQRVEGELTAERAVTSKAEVMHVLGYLYRIYHLCLASCRCAAMQLQLSQEREIEVGKVPEGEWMSERDQNEAAMKSPMQKAQAPL